MLESARAKLATLGNWTFFALQMLWPTCRVVPRFSVWLKPFHDILVGGWPLALVLGFALGAVTWMHTRGVLERTAGATELLPTVLAAAVLLELAPVGAGLIVASRTGASLGAELAAMRVTEQVDALKMLGVSPRYRLFAPRILACCLAVPLVHVLVAALAIGSGFAAEQLSGQMSWIRYQRAILLELTLADVVAAAAKTLIFGWLIGTTGCFMGLNARDGSEGVGEAATKSVVFCSLLVLIADVLLVALIRLLLN